MARRKNSEPTSAHNGSTEAAIVTDPNFGDAPTMATYVGTSVLKRVSPCCVEVDLGDWHFQMTSPETIRLTADHNDGRKLPPG
jgi:hypothetical protein